MQLPEQDLWRRLEATRLLDVEETAGRFEMFLPTPTVQVTRASGHLSHRMAVKWMGALEPIFERGTVLSCFHHWLGVTGYESASRVATTRWAIRRASGCSEIRFLTRSKLVSMSIATVNLATAQFGLLISATPDTALFTQGLIAELARDQAWRANGNLAL
jgi:hypothetical protein